MDSSYAKIQFRMAQFAASVLKLVPSFKEAGIPGSAVDQLVRSSLSIGSNYAEARAAESHADFLHKLQVALKEAREAQHQLTVLTEMPRVPTRTVRALWNECDQFCAILYSSVQTAKKSAASRIGSSVSL